MSKFVLIYHGGKPPETDEEKDVVMAAWGAWMEGAGDALVDFGNPFGPPTSMGGEAAEPASGYSIIEADDSDGAKKLLADHPMTGVGGGRIDIYEAFKM